MRLKIECLYVSAHGRCPLAEVRLTKSQNKRNYANLKKPKVNTSDNLLNLRKQFEDSSFRFTLFWYVQSDLTLNFAKHIIFLA